MSKYDDIIHLPHHISQTRAQMSLHDRAAQFSPFAALVGYEDAVAEAGRQTAARKELDEQAKAELDQRFALLLTRLSEHPTLTVEYFIPDERKSGGSYRTITGRLKKVLPATRTLVLDNGLSLQMEDITKLFFTSEEKP